MKFLRWFYNIKSFVEHQRKLYRALTTCAAFIVCPIDIAFAQLDIPIGTWRTHLSYNQITCVALGDQKVFAAGNHGIMVVDQSDNSINSFSKINGLNGTTIAFVNHHIQTKRLLISYSDGRFDVVSEGGEVIGFDPAKNSSVTGSKKINHILIDDSFAYLSADYGVIVFDIVRMTVKETWRDLGSAGTTLRIFQSTILGDSIFLGTENGVLAANLSANLQDFSNWKRFNSGDFIGAVQHVSTFNNKIYLGINTKGIYHYDVGAWIKDSFLQDESFRSINASTGGLLIAGENNLFRLNTTNNLSEITDVLITQPYFATEDINGKLWIGDGVNGLVTNGSGDFNTIIPNCPSTDRVFELAYHEKTIFALAGGYSSTRSPLGNPGRIDVFKDGAWSNQGSAMQDLTSLSQSESTGKICVSSFGYGIEVRDSQGNTSSFDETNSPLYNSNPPGRFVNVTSTALNGNGIWVANYASPQPLHLLNNDNNWESFSFPLIESKYPLKLLVDFSENVWIAIDPLQGGGLLVFNKNANTTAYLTDVIGSGGLPSKNVNTITVDREGTVWVGTDAGVAYFINPTSVFSGTVNAIKPIFDNRFLLRDDKVTSIVVDGGNRKWIGTQRGLWLFNESGEELVYNFNTTNSPLLSDVIQDIEVNGATGEVFFATAEGLLSFRSDATESKNTFESVKVFPNPVTANFVGSIGITGLATDALLKITDINGKLIWQTQANGGSASWNAQDVNGARPPTGIYIVFAVTEDGRESAVAKIAFVD